MAKMREMTSIRRVKAPEVITEDKIPFSPPRFEFTKPDIAAPIRKTASDTAPRFFVGFLTLVRNIAAISDKTRRNPKEKSIPKRKKPHLP